MLWEHLKRIILINIIVLDPPILEVFLHIITDLFIHLEILEIMRNTLFVALSPRREVLTLCHHGGDVRNHSGIHHDSEEHDEYCDDVLVEGERVNVTIAFRCTRDRGGSRNGTAR